MAIAEVSTLLSLDHYAAILGIDPRHFNQMYCVDFPDQGGCSCVWFQYDWMDAGHASRDELARAIAQAESMIAEFVGFWPAPKYIEAEHLLYPKRRQYVSADGVWVQPQLLPNRYKNLQTHWGRFVEGGRRATESIEAGAAVTLSNPDGDDYDELATVEVTYTGSATLREKDIGVFFAGVDASTDRSRLRNLNVAIAGNVITITGYSAQFTDPALWENDDSIDGDLAASYVATVDVYRVYTEYQNTSNAPVMFVWQTTPTSGLGAAVSMGYDYGVLQPWDTKPGVVTPIPATWNVTAAEWRTGSFSGNEPHMAYLWYLAGWVTDTQGRMTAPFARAVAALATSLLHEPICGCGRAEKMSSWWQGYPNPREDVTSYRQLDCPWGSKRGAWEAYAALSQLYTGAGAISA